MTRKALEIVELWVEFPEFGSSVQVVRGCSLEIVAGEILGLVGESGCGKSMTALACLGMVPSGARVQGSILLDGSEIIGRGESSIEQLRGGTAAMIFQNPAKALNPFFTIGRQIGDVVRRHRQLPGRGVRSEVIHALRAVQLPDPELVLKRYPHQLSGGQLQRVMIAMAIACQPVLLLADEPTTALDVTIQAQMVALLQEVAQERDLTVLFITHDLSLVAALCDRVAVMYAGQVVETGSLADVFETPAHPYTCRLLDTVPRLGQGKVSPDSIPGQVPDMARLPSGCSFHPRCDRATEICRTEAPIASRVSSAHTTRCHHPVRYIEEKSESVGA